MKARLPRNLLIPLLSALCVCLSGCYTTRYVEEFSSIKNTGLVRDILPWINDTVGLKYCQYSFSSRPVELDFADNTDSNWHCYIINYYHDGKRKEIYYYDEAHAISYYTIYLRSGVVWREHTDSTYKRAHAQDWFYVHSANGFFEWGVTDTAEERKNSVWWGYAHGHPYTGCDRYYDEINGRMCVRNQYDSFDIYRYRSVEYYPGGTVRAIWHYYKYCWDGEGNCYYPNGKLKSHFICDMGKVVSITEYGPDGSKVEATNVTNGNGRWLRCANDDTGNYCCDCDIVNGNIKKCKTLDAGKKGK